MSVRTNLEDLLALATTAREQQRQEALEDVEALRVLLPVEKTGPRRARAAALLADLTDDQTLAALDLPKSKLATLLTHHHLRLTHATARRLLTEHATSKRPIPPASQRRLAEIEKKIRAALRAADANAYEIGKQVDRVARERLHRLGGSKRTLAEWADEQFPHHGYRTLSRYRRIAKSFSKRTVMTHGTEKLDFGLQYLDLTPEPDRPADLLRAEILVPAKGRIRFLEISAADLQKAVKALRTERSTPPVKTLPRGADRTFESIRRTLAAVPVAEGLTAPTVTVRIARSAQKKTVALFTAHDLPQHIAERLLASAGDR